MVRRRPRREVAVETVGTVRIESIAAGGDGVGRIDGMACFVPRTAPGDLAQIAYVPHARYARGRLLQLLEASPHRVDPPCRHYVRDRCGGCQLQHLDPDTQRAVRQQIVCDAMQRVGRREVPLPELVAGDAWQYRERLTVALRAKGATWIGGLHAFDDPSRVFALEECPIAHPRLMECWVRARRALRGLPTTGAGTTLRLSLRLCGAAGDRVAVVVHGGHHWPDADQWAAGLRNTVPSVAGVWWEPEGGRATLLAGEATPEVLAFAQVNPVVARALREEVLAVINRHEPASVIDAYAGRGDLALPLAMQGIRVAAIEADPIATSAAAARLAPYASARVITALVEDAITAALPADVVVLNPPRRGVDVRVASSLAEAAERGVRAIVYVSCDPATLARDVARLARWRIASMRCFDMFPQTAHVETVCVLIPEAA